MAVAAVNAFQASNQPMWDLSDSVNLIRGKHTFTIGANYRRWKLNRDLANNFLGSSGLRALLPVTRLRTCCLGITKTGRISHRPH